MGQPQAKGHPLGSHMPPPVGKLPEEQHEAHIDPRVLEDGNVEGEPLDAPE